MKKIFRIWQDFGEGLRNGLVPMLSKEMRGRTRNWRGPLLLSIYLAVLGGCVVLFLWLNSRGSTVIPQVGLILYSILVFALMLLLGAIAAVVAATAISGERERRTYDLLLVTRASLAGIVLGKWLASVVYLLFLAIAALPVLGVVYFFGGMPLKNVAVALGLCLMTGLGYGALGLAFSAIFRRSQTAIIVSLITVFGLIFGTLIISAIVVAGNPQVSYNPEMTPQITPPQYVFLSPVVTMASVLPGSGQGAVSSFSGIAQRLAGGPGMTSYAMGGSSMLVMSGGPGSGFPTGYTGTKVVKGLAGWAPLAKFTLYQSLLALASLLVATFAINPLRPWLMWQARRRSMKQAANLSG